MSKGTTRRSVRVEDELWESAKSAAERAGESLSDVLRLALIEYVEASKP